MCALSGEFVSAIAGAVVGGLIAFGIQIIALKSSEKARKDEAAERKAALAHSLMFKMLQIHAHLLGFSQHMEDAFEKGKKDKIKEPWAFVQAIANHPEKVHFSSDEMAMLLSLGDIDLFSDVLVFDEVHNTSIETFVTYRDRRLRLTDQLSATFEANDSLKGSTEFTKEEREFYQPKMNELNDLANDMSEMMAGYAKNAGEISRRLGALLHEKAGLVQKLEVAAKSGGNEAEAAGAQH